MRSAWDIADSKLPIIEEGLKLSAEPVLCILYQAVNGLLTSCFREVLRSTEKALAGAKEKS